MAMLSRVASSIYWLGRYLERAENTARLVNVNGSLVLDLPRPVRPNWLSIIAITGSQPLFHEYYPDGGETQVLRFMAGDERNPSSILSCLRSARENARSIRDIFPREAWEQINGVYLDAKDTLRGSLPPMRRHDALRAIILGVQQVGGVLSGCMSHDAGFEFLRLGQNLERADMTTRIIDVRCADLGPDRADLLKPFENILWMSVLRSLTAYQMYRRHVQATVRRANVVNFLLLDREFPRSFRFCLDAVDDCLKRLPHCEATREALTPLMQTLESSHPENLDQNQLHDFIDELQLHLGDVHGALRTCYFGEGSLTTSA